MSDKSNFTRTEEEILDRIKEIKDWDFLGFEAPDLICRLSFSNAKEFLNNTATEEKWTRHPKDRESILKEMNEYMSFAWEKANGRRGISASRSMSHYSAWIWLIGDDLGDLHNYSYYGKDNLVRICKHYGWAHHLVLDDGERVN